jgi:acetyltransferase-like isoleucine patch superfamily enzyme
MNFGPTGWWSFRGVGAVCSPSSTPGVYQPPRYHPAVTQADGPRIALRVLKRRVRAVLDAVARRPLRRAGVVLGRDVRVFGRPFLRLAERGSIILGDRVVLSSRPAANSLEARGPCMLRTVLPGARIVVGDDTGMTSATISASSSIRIGARVLIGAGVVITDSDHHPVHPPAGTPRRFAEFPAPTTADAVVIEDDVFIGARAIILKGVRIGAGAVVGAGSVVSRDVSAESIVAGNPATVVGSTGSRTPPAGHEGDGDR